MAAEGHCGGTPETGQWSDITDSKEKEVMAKKSDWGVNREKD